MKLPSFAPVNIGNDGSGEGGLVIEELNINVSQLDSDADYEEIADKVGKALEKKLTKGKAIGGIRIHR